MAQQINLKPFINPQSVALIGVSSRTGPGAFNVMEQMLGIGYKGKIYPVNPRGGTILNIPAYKSVLEIEAPVDLAVIATPRTVVPGVVRQCVAKSIPAVVVITQGFSDAEDEDGPRLHQEILDAIEGTQTRVVGPNTLGVVNTFINFNTSFITYDTNPAPVGVICQSGIFLAGSADFSGGLGIGIDTGNTADIGFTECMEYLAGHPQIKVINIHMEGVRDGRRFLECARQITPHKPVLVLKTGSSEEGARAASSHSGSMAGEDAVFSAAFAQSGVIRLDSADHMADLNRTLATYREMRGKRVGVITISGGAGIIAVDAAGKHAMEIASFSPDTMSALNSVFPDWMHPGNPADIWPAGMSRGYREVTAGALDKILSDDAVDAVLCITPAYLDPDTDPLNIIGLINDVAARHPQKPTAMWIFGPHKVKYADRFAEAGLVVAYGSPDNAMYCLAQLYHYHSAVKGADFSSYLPPVNIDHDLVSSTLESSLNAGLPTLNEEALDIIEAYGIPVVRRSLAKNPEEAADQAEMLGYPVVMKIASPDVPHKSDLGGIKLNINSKDDAVRAYNEIMDNVMTRIPHARINGILLQSQVSDGTEVILGGRRDPQFGPVLVYGLGGIFTELMRDVSFRVAPITRHEALEMIRETRSYKILSGARGREPGDIEGLADCLIRLGALLHDHPEIAEVDINPLLVTAKGCLAVDALIVL
ncbi:MAG TPA: CoA-binding protein [Desulfotomaculum sp.]|nr:MAG: CoA-binding protein [Desulfotomaculum sp. BICA1-6]HBX24239.1 CoA-binding protein [Desulfotomaculum sp.]